MKPLKRLYYTLGALTLALAAATGIYQKVHTKDMQLEGRVTSAPVSQEKHEDTKTALDYTTTPEEFPGLTNPLVSVPAKDTEYDAKRAERVRRVVAYVLTASVEKYTWHLHGFMPSTDGKSQSAEAHLLLDDKVYLILAGNGDGSVKVCDDDVGLPVGDHLSIMMWPDGKTNAKYTVDIMDNNLDGIPDIGSIGAEASGTGQQQYMRRKGRGLDAYGMENAGVMQQELDRIVNRLLTFFETGK